jgi:hypothetical protein
MKIDHVFAKQMEMLYEQTPSHDFTQNRLALEQCNYDELKAMQLLIERNAHSK